MIRPSYNPRFTELDGNGDPYSGGKLYTYETGTTTPKTTWSDRDKATPNENPVVLDSRGSAMVWLDTSTGAYRFRLYDSDDNLIWTEDDIGAESGSMGYYYPDADAADQGITGDSNTIKYYVDTAGSNKASIYLAHTSGDSTTTYTFSTSEVIPSNITIVREDGAQIALGGSVTLSHAGPIISPKSTMFSLTDRDSFTYTGPSVLSSKMFGALHDGSTDDSNALNDLVGASAEGASIVIDAGLSTCNSVDFDVDALHVRFVGRLKPAADSGYCIRVGEGTSGTVRNLTVKDLDVDSGSDYETFTTVTAVEVSNLNSSDIHFRRVEGCKTGILLTNASAEGVSYNRFHLDRIVDNEVNIKINPANSGWVNENSFFGGRFTHFSGKADYSGTWHIRIEYNATHNPNSNYFYKPSFEGSGDQIFYCGGRSNGIIDCRMEMAGGYASDTVYFTSNAERNDFIVAFSNNLLDNGPSVTDTITTTSETVFSLDADVRSNLFAGQLLEITLDDAAEHVVAVGASAYSDPNTTVYLSHPIPGLVLTTNEIASIKYLPIYNDGRGNRLFIDKADYPAVSNYSYDLRHEVFQVRHGGLALRGLSDEVPALSLIPASSAGDTVFHISDFAGTTVTIDANGGLTVFDGSTGQKLIEYDTGNTRINLYDASEDLAVRLDGSNGSVRVSDSGGNTAVTLDGSNECITFGQKNDGSGAPSNSFFVRSSDNLLCWKNNSGTIQTVDVT